MNIQISINFKWILSIGILNKLIPLNGVTKFLFKL